METEAIEVVPSRHEAWRERFHAERERLEDCFEAADLTDAIVRIEHVGSTAVPGLDAKDIVDLNVVVDGIVPAVSSAVANRLGGTRYENSDEWQPVARAANGQRFNVQIFDVASDGWKRSVVTRDVLRAEPRHREPYERLKRRLAADHEDLPEYSRGKTAFIDDLLRRARGSDAVDVPFDVPVPDRTE